MRCTMIVVFGPSSTASSRLTGGFKSWLHRLRLPRHRLDAVVQGSTSGARPTSLPAIGPVFPRSCLDRRSRTTSRCAAQPLTRFHNSIPSRTDMNFLEGK